ncbi:MAG: hypothetical protein GXY33_09315 [Phycisphaerae bacterium]|nr:hypothetical protein [Phycisphaerae bacterium]
MAAHSVNWREQIQKAISGDQPEAIPAVLRIDKWYNACIHGTGLPDELSGMSIEQVEDHLGFARSARGAKVYDIRYRPPVERIERQEGDRVITEWRTASGNVRCVRSYGPGDREAGLSPTIVEYPIRTLDDYRVFAEIAEAAEFVPAYDTYRTYDAAIGPSGLPMVILGAIPFHELLIRWTGYERGYLDLFDRPDVVLEAVERANRAWRRMWPIVAESPAELVMHGVNFDSMMTSPPVFREHFLPYLREFTAAMHTAGKKVAFHGDGDMSDLLDLVVEAGFDVADCLACAPMVRCTIAQARSAWRDKITIWGGIPSPMFEPSTPIEKLRDHLEMIYRQLAPGDRFMLGVADQIMPGASWQHVKLVSHWVREHRDYPIRL